MAVELRYRPESPVTHSLRWFTEVLEAPTGDEQRIAHLTTPRQTVALRLKFTDLTDMRQFRTLLYRNLNATWRIPRWWEHHATSVKTLSGSAFWYFDTSSADFSVGDRVYVEDPSGSPREFLTVAVVNPAYIQTSAGASATFAVGTRMYGAPDAKLSGAPSFSRTGQGQEIVDLTFDLASVIDIGGQGASGLSTYQASTDTAARQLLDREPLANSPLRYTALNLSSRVDNGRTFEQFADADHMPFVEARTYSIRSHADLQWWERFMELIVGGREPFYSPTYRQDLVVSSGGQPSGPSWNTITVNDESDDVTDTDDYAVQWFTKSAYKNLYLDTDLGDQYAEVSSAVDNADGTVTLTLTSGLTSGTVVNGISFLERLRLASDAVVFRHDGLRSRVKIGVRVVQA